MSIAEITSSFVVDENRLRKIYPVLSSNIVAEPTLYIGMLSLIIETSNGFVIPILLIVTNTSLPFLPLSFLNTSDFVILYASSLSIAIILSPGISPTISDGLSGTGEITVIYPSSMSNSIPIPWKLPLNNSLIFSCSFAGMYVE